MWAFVAQKQEDVTYHFEIFFFGVLLQDDDHVFFVPHLFVTDFALPEGVASSLSVYRYAVATVSGF